MPAITAPSQAVTKTDFELLPEAFRRYEVDRGELVENEPMGNLESALAAHIACLFCQALGTPASREVMGPDARFRLARNPDLIRGCDVSYVPKNRMPGGRPDSGVGDYVPALAVEIVSPSNRAALMAQRIDEWFSAGVSVLWVICPAQKCVYVYSSPTELRILKTGQILDGADVLPGLQIAVEQLLA